MSAPAEVPMNVLFVSSQFPNSLAPNRGIFSLQIAREMAGLARVRVIAPVPTLGPLRVIDGLKRYRTNLPVPASEIIGGLPVEHPRYLALPRMGFLHHRAMYGALRPVIRRLHRESPIDAVNCHWLFPDGVAVQRICAELGIPVMLTALGCDLNLYSTFRFRREAIRAALAGAERVSVLNSAMRDTCSRLGMAPDRVAIIPNGVDTDLFTILDRSACRTELGLPADGPVVLFVGSLDPVKGIDTLLRAFALLSGRHPVPPRLAIVGGGHLEQPLKALAEELGLSDRVEFAGPVGHSRLPVWMNAADCLCLPSLREGHPNVMMEALACGTPVVGSAVGSVPDFIDGATGFLAAPGNADDLADKLGRCLAASYDRNAVRGRVEHFSWRDCARAYVAELARIRRPRLADGADPASRLSRPEGLCAE